MSIDDNKLEGEPQKTPTLVVVQDPVLVRGDLERPVPVAVMEPVTVKADPERPVPVAVKEPVQVQANLNNEDMNKLLGAILQWRRSGTPQSSPLFSVLGRAPR